ncbi:MAG: diguanylate cyclase [Wenzhouxiangella sp.]
MSADNRDSLTDPHTVLLSPGDETASSDSPVLVVIRGERLGARLDLAAAPLVIGRSSECDFRIAARSVSRTHCRFFQDGQAFWVEDLGSTNQTFVNDEVIACRRLRDGDQVRVGKTVLKFLDAGNPEAHYLAELHETSIRDSLTGLHNRAHAMQVLEEEFRRAQRVADAGLVLAIIDIDWFKQINDEIGHLAGDAVLVHLARVLSNALRAGDTLARIGGEEFALIMPDTSLAEAHQACDRLRQRVAEESFLTDCGQRLEVTISIGLAEATASMAEFRELLGQADSHLYDAKTAGRNSVRSHAA